MKHKRASVQNRLETLKSVCIGNKPDEIHPLVRKALKDAHQLMVGQAALMCGEYMFHDMDKDLITAYRRFLENPVKKDPNCRAKTAIARALVELDCQDYNFFIEGIKYRQFEPVWGGSIDTAVDLRLACAVGLTNTSYSRALIELVPLLYDMEPQVRIGVVGVFSRTEPFASEAVLHGKILSGDSEPAVITEALTELIRISPEASMDFVSGYFDKKENPAFLESLALTLGASRLEEALKVLQTCWDKEPLKKRAVIFLRGAALHRSEEAFSWLIGIVAEGDTQSARFVLEELSMYHTDEKLTSRLKSALSQRGDENLLSFFHEIHYR